MKSPGPEELIEALSCSPGVGPSPRSATPITAAVRQGRSGEARAVAERGVAEHSPLRKCNSFTSTSCARCAGPPARFLAALRGRNAGGSAHDGGDPGVPRPLLRLMGVFRARRIGPRAIGLDVMPAAPGRRGGQGSHRRDQFTKRRGDRALHQRNAEGARPARDPDRARRSWAASWSTSTPGLCAAFRRAQAAVTKPWKG